jgi:hypothetical protein
MCRYRTLRTMSADICPESESNSDWIRGGERHTGIVPCALRDGRESTAHSFDLLSALPASIEPSTYESCASLRSNEVIR